MPHLPLLTTTLLLTLSAAASADSSSISSTCDTVHRPNLYVGTKTCSSLPISTGLMWFAHGETDKIRHTAEMTDGLKKWGWAMHDGTHYGKHTLLDPKAQMVLTSEYQRREEEEEEEEDEEVSSSPSSSSFWSMRVRGNLTSRGRKSRDKGDAERNDISLVFYVTNADPNGVLNVVHERDDSGRSISTITGESLHEGSFSFRVVRAATVDGATSMVPTSKRRIVTHNERVTELAKGKNPNFGSGSESEGVHYVQLKRNPENLWQTKDILLPFWQQSSKQAGARIAREWEKEGKDPRVEGRRKKNQKNLPSFLPLLTNMTESNANLVALQYVVAAPFDIVIEYSKGAVTAAATSLSSPLLSKDGEQEKRKFQTKFENIFHLKEKGFDESHVTFAQSAFSNLIGSVTYFHGSSSVKTLDGRPATTEPGPLITGVPSRSFFPRGFLWDEGFHQLLVSAWNIQLSRTVVQHWLSRMDENGWCVVLFGVVWCCLVLLVVCCFESFPDPFFVFFIFRPL